MSHYLAARPQFAASEEAIRTPDRWSAPCAATLVWMTLLGSLAAQDTGFRVVQITPNNKTAEVELEPLIQVHVSERFDSRTATADAVRLLDAGGKPVSAQISADLGGVITLSVDAPLQPGRDYTIEVTRSLQTPDGRRVAAVKSRFRTTDARPSAPREDLAAFQFHKARIVVRDGLCGLALLPGRRLFACSWDGALIEYPLDERGRPGGEPRTWLDLASRRCVAIVGDPRASPETPVLWLSHDSQHRLSVGPNDFSGVISRITIQGESVRQDDFVVGLPAGDHPSSGLVFGPDGRLFISQGALSMLGGKESLPETPLSAATLTVDLASPAFAPDSRPLDVRTIPPVSYDPSAGPVRLYATGIREAFDLCWHSNGSLYAGVNMNDTNERTPSRDGLPAVSVRPTEMLLRILPGRYFGHPNPSRNEWVLLGGNPTADVDPWEVATLPVGTRPEPAFDPALLIRNLERDKGPSADGCCEWTGPGPLHGRLVICFYTATRGLHTYAFSDDGTTVIDHQPLLDEQGRLLRFGAPLDVVYDSGGWLYVADFSAPERGDSGQQGGVWRVAPIQAGSPGE